MSLKQNLIAHIAQTGPITVAQYMAACLYDPRLGYYATRPRIGGEGDFVTAPEVSQMFGELIGLWCVHEWETLGRPDPLRWVELGPGGGALISDAHRAARIAPGFRRAVRIELVEVSEPLRAAQTKALARVSGEIQWRDRLEDVAAGPSLIVANEFLDCLPIRQFARTDGWREVLIGVVDGDLGIGLMDQPIGFDDPMIPARARDANVFEIAPGLADWVDSIATRLMAAPGRALIIDYAGDGTGDTLQALRAHKKENPLTSPGEADLTARVDFAALKILARASGLGVAGSVGQGDFLHALGIAQRAEALAAAHPERAERIGRELARLTAGDQMGTLFQVLCLSSPDLPPPVGF